MSCPSSGWTTSRSPSRRWRGPARRRRAQARAPRPSDLLCRRGCRREAPLALSPPAAKAGEGLLSCWRDLRAAHAGGVGADGMRWHLHRSRAASSAQPRLFDAHERTERGADHRRSAVQPRFAQLATCCSAKWVCRERRRSPPAWGTDVQVLEDLAAQGHAPGRCSIGASLASGHLYRQPRPGRLRADRPGAHLLCAGLDYHRTSVLKRSESAEHPGTDGGRPQDVKAFIAEPRPSPDQRRQSQIESDCWRISAISSS